MQLFPAAIDAMNDADQALTPLVYPSLAMIMDLPTGLDVISRLPLANSQLAHTQVKEFLDEMLKGPPAFDIHLELLEQLRPSLCFIAEDLARQFVNKPLPLGETEEERFRQTTVMWIKMARSYAACAKRFGSVESPEQLAQFALVLHRFIYYTGMALSEHHRARREPPGALWADLRAYYAIAEKRGVSLLSVPDALDARERSTHCASAFLGLLLTEMANPCSLTINAQHLVRTWAENWSELVSVHPLLPNEPIPPFVIDLGSGTGKALAAAVGDGRGDTASAATGSVGRAGLRPSLPGEPVERLRRLDTSRLSEHLKDVRKQIDQKTAPAKLGLGERCTQRQCKHLLDHLLYPWSQVLTPRAFPRRSTSGEARLGIGFAATLACVSGKPPSGATTKAAKAASKDASAEPESGVASAGRMPLSLLAPDDWQVVDASATGFRVAREAAGNKLEHGQLVAVCPHDGERYLLAQVSWLMQKRRGLHLLAGIAALPGMPTAVEVRSLATESEAPARAKAFMLPAVGAKSKASLVLPPGWFQPSRVIEIATRPTQRVRLRRLVKSGPDFEQVSYSADGA